MSGFRIPGLGQAKPDEILPPLPADQAVGASSAEKDKPTTAVITHAITDTAEPSTNADQATRQEQTPTDTKGGPDPMVVDRPETTDQDTTADQQTIQEQAQPNSDGGPDSMAVDQPESPPSLTGALEAALGGLEPDNAEEVLAQTSTAQGSAPQDTEGQNGQPEWEMDSSPYQSSTDTTSSESSSEEDSDNEGYELLGVEETARLLMEAEGGSDDEGDKAGKPSTAAHLRTKNEQPEEPIPRPDVTVTAEMKIEELGAIEHIVENMVLIKAITPGEYQVLDTGSVLCNADRVVLGAVAETIGKVTQPMYTMLFNTGDEIRELGIEVGTKVFYPVDHASFVFTEPLKNLKGSDASNLHDEEVNDDEMEFSDDEKEAEYKRSLKEKRRKRAAAAAGGGGASGRGGRDPHPLRQEMGTNGELNYDDDDGPYKPLTRPPGFGDGPVSQETYEPQPRSNFRGRGRGDSRGRGGRGRGSNRGGRGGAPRDGYALPPQGLSSQYPPPPQHQHQPPPPPNWNAQAQGSPAPAIPNFGFQFPGWPQPPPAQGGQSNLPAPPPPPPPGWPGSAQGQEQAAGGAGANFMNPALLAALMSHMQAQQGGQQQWQPRGGQGQ
ncbi:H/ACA ribonucleoprotein complex non-core subunit-like protein [Hapsidospora chrysogenum ATCC 11550]|uniref:H/ACA ribonucleoprotein complex non-core subunit NAF1 n=1 Tax=Hapsidospora chrysogenum (strain ATCC 11550 / CBS 779.69 / DSM 880 / IAM 14645 / JCM 23072 / IMI 49137) TaxID=857340 RepID=A0A086STQ9_HAPC1|nr:H/ACA ribonucleoprotein complex non-core subunit-like protein [Hapsidospora chrysogenum ATCC 11550]